MPTVKQQQDRIRQFPGLAEHEASAYEGKVDFADFNGQKVRRVCHAGEWWYSVADALGAITGSVNPGTYWRVHKKRLIDEGAGQTVTDCNGFKLPAPDGKMRKADCANTKIMLRIVQSVPHPNAEPFKLWLAELGQERIEEIAQPSKIIDRAVATYRRKGWDDERIDLRIANRSARNEFTDELDARGFPEGEIPRLTADMGREMLGVTPSDHRSMKGIKKHHDLRDNYTKLEMAVVTLGEQAAKTLMQARNADGPDETREASMDGAEIAGDAARKIELKTGKPVASAENFLAKPTGMPALSAAKKAG